MGFPNEEVEEGFLRYLLPYYTGLHDVTTPFSMSQFIGDKRLVNTHLTFCNTALLLYFIDFDENKKYYFSISFVNFSLVFLLFISLLCSDSYKA